jgi:hypothetical protein
MVAARLIEFPNGAKLHGYWYEAEAVSSNETRVQRKADRIEYPDGRKVENPGADEINGLFPKERNEVEEEVPNTEEDYVKFGV